MLVLTGSSSSMDEEVKVNPRDSQLHHGQPTSPNLEKYSQADGGTTTPKEDMDWIDTGLRNPKISAKEVEAADFQVKVKHQRAATP
jgi:hypothetical protein